jgi:hypothetical protein
MFESRRSGDSAKRRVRKAAVVSMSRPYIQETSPSANMFFARAASLRFRSNSSTEATVTLVRSTAWRM